MPQTPYTGNPTATQSPSPAPGTNVAPVVNLPQDGTALNFVQLFSQQYKVFADFIAWITSHGAWRDIANTFTQLATFAQGLTVSNGTLTAGDIDSSGNVRASSGGNISTLSPGNLQVTGRILAKQIRATTAAKPTVSAGASVVNGSTNMAGWVTLPSAGSTPNTSLATITFDPSLSYTNAPTVVIGPCSNGGSFANVYVASTSTTGFVIGSINTVATDTKIGYVVIGN